MRSLPLILLTLALFFGSMDGAQSDHNKLTVHTKVAEQPSPSAEDVKSEDLYCFDDVAKKYYLLPCEEPQHIRANWGRTAELPKLPPCPADQDKHYHNCFGTIVLPDGNKYIGGFKNGKMHGRGSYIFLKKIIYADGE